MIPNLFSKEPVPEKIPESMEDKIKEFAKSKDKEIFLKKSFYHVVSKSRPRRGFTILRCNEAFKTDIIYLWEKKGYIPCTSLNYLVRVMLVKSGLFREEDIELKLTNTWYIMIHQYLRVRINEKKYINVDPFGYSFGIRFGDYAHGFHAGTLTPVKK